MNAESYALAGTDQGDALDALIARAQAGEESAFEEILDRFEGRALSIAFHLGVTRDDAEDVVQEAFVKLFRHIGSYRGGRRFTSYFYRIVVNAARDHLRESAARRGAGPVREGDLHAIEGRGGGADAERRLQVRMALLELSDREREVILLRDLHGLGSWEVARILGLNPITVRRHAMRARERLRKILGG